MNIYDEAIKEVKKLWNGNELTYPKHTIKVLERAKKEHELLGLYQDRFSFYNFDEDKSLREIKALEEELK